MMMGNTKIPSRRTIPRPWLSKRDDDNFSNKSTNLDLLEQPRWTVSWSKLSICFCVRPDSSEHRLRDVPFPAFPAIRRDDSCSFGSRDFLPEDVSRRHLTTFIEILMIPH